MTTRMTGVRAEGSYSQFTTTQGAEDGEGQKVKNSAGKLTGRITMVGRNVPFLC